LFTDGGPFTADCSDSSVIMFVCLKHFYLMEAGSAMFEFYTALFDRVSKQYLLLE